MKTIKIIDLLNKIANGETFENCKMKFKEIELEEVREYVIYDRLYEEDLNLNDEVEILDEEDEFEDIEEFVFGEVEDVAHYEMKDKINQLIKNQKKIIERLKDE